MSICIREVMGAGASAGGHYPILEAAESAQTTFVLPSSFTADFKGKFKPLVTTIAEDDAVFLNDVITMENKREYRKISDRIFVKTKSMLQRIRKMYGKFDYIDGAPASDLISDIKEGIPGAYGSFMRSLFLNRLEFNIEQLDIALSGLGCDEDVIIDTISTATPMDFADIQKVVASNSHPSIKLDTIKEKLPPGSKLQSIMMRILRGKRDPETAEIDRSIITARVAHMAELRKLGDLDEIINLLCKMSRAACAVLSEELVAAEGVTLFDYIPAITKNPKGTMVLQLWTLPQRASLIECIRLHLNRVSSGELAFRMDDTNAVCRIIASLDKHQLDPLCADYKSITGLDLFEQVTSKLEGNLKYALEIYLKGKPYDGGSEHRLLEFMAAHQGEPALNDADSEQLNLLLHEACDTMSAYLEALRTRRSNNLVVAQRSSDLIRSPEEPLLSESFPVHKAPEPKEGPAVAVEEAPPAVFEITERQSSEDPPPLFSYLMDVFEMQHPNASGDILSKDFWLIVQEAFSLVFTEYDMNKLKVS